MNGRDHHVHPELERQLKQREELMRYLAVLVERMGGEVRISPGDLADGRMLQKDIVTGTGVVVLRVSKTS